jgi:hypothetical protein
MLNLLFSTPLPKTPLFWSNDITILMWIFKWVFGQFCYNRHIFAQSKKLCEFGSKNNLPSISLHENWHVVSIGRGAHGTNNFSVLLHDEQHLLCSHRSAVGEEGDQQGHVVNVLQVGSNVFDAPW